jgi:hydrogenase maturation protease
LKQQPSRRETIDLLIAGLGNSIRMDDGVGIHAAAVLRKEVEAGWNPAPRGDLDQLVKIAEIGTSPIDALPLLESARKVIALDAVQAGGTPGSVYRLKLEAVRKGGPDTSLHELDLRDALRLLPEERRPEVVVLGVEPACIDFGLELSPALHEALPGFLDQIRRVAAELLRSDDPMQ